MTQKIFLFSFFRQLLFPFFFYRLSDWVEILWGFTKSNFKLNLKVSAFYLEKQKSFVTKNNIFWDIPPRWIPEMALGDSIFQKVLVPMNLQEPHSLLWFDEKIQPALQSLRQGMGVFWNADASPCHFSPRKGAKLSDALTQPFRFNLGLYRKCLLFNFPRNTLIHWKVKSETT